MKLHVKIHRNTKQAATVSVVCAAVMVAVTAVTVMWMTRPPASTHGTMTLEELHQQQARNFENSVEHFRQLSESLGMGRDYPPLDLAPQEEVSDPSAAAPYGRDSLDHGGAAGDPHAVDPDSAAEVLIGELPGDSAY